MASKSRVSGITIKIDGDVTGLDKALKGVNGKIKDTQTQLKDVQRLLKFDPGNTELLRQKQELLGKAVGNTKEKLAQLKDAEKQLKDAGVDQNSEQFQALRREIIATEDSLDGLKDAANESNVALEKIGATADKVSSGAQKVADATAGISRTAQAGLAAAAAATVKIVDSYADYEQLIGGVETLFKGDADALVARANDAYKTAGLSANAYMETATGFAASLVSSLGGDTKKAVDLADMAITDMADNTNKMGSDISSIQNAYQGFSKQNYTMLDNLKLGYGGTKEEMQRLLDEAEKLSGIHYDIGNYADIVNAIHVIQDEMGITGTTAKEAEGTISGSIAAFKSSVSNLLAGMGDANADVDQLTDNVVEAFKTMAGNIIPILQNIWDHLPGGAKFALGGMAVMAAISPVAGAISNISGAVGKLTTIIPKIGTAFSSMASFVMANPIVLLIAAIVALVALIATKGDEIQAALQKLDDWLQGIFAKDWTEIFGPVLGDILNGFFANVKNIWDSIKQVFDGVIDFIRGVFTGDWQRAWEGVKEIFGGVFSGLATLAKAPINGIIALLNGAINGINMMIDALNGLHFTIPSWVPLLGGKSFGLHLARVGSIPYLAKGGILSQGSAVVGEAGPELLTLTGGKAVVQPLSGNGPSLKGVEGLLGGISDKLGAGQPVTIVVQSVLDGRVIGETAYDYTMQRARARG
nr:MAG TPA: tail tape measure protein [Caudoviricetes sp.]